MAFRPLLRFAAQSYRPDIGLQLIHMFNVTDDALTINPAFKVVDFNMAFPTGPARPHGAAMK